MYVCDMWLMGHNYVRFTKHIRLNEHSAFNYFLPCLYLDNNKKYMVVYQASLITVKLKNKKVINIEKTMLLIE